MTKEEAIGILEQTFINTDGHIKPSNPAKRTALNIHQALTIAIDTLSQPSLPSNLDEAAKEIAYSVCRQLPNGEEKDNIVYYAILAAKSGAKWMAEQGETQEHIRKDALLEWAEDVKAKTGWYEIEIAMDDLIDKLNSL